MVNAYRKGLRAENDCEKALKSDGWVIEFRSIRIRNHRIDYAGVADVVARKGGVRRYVSVTHKGNESIRRKAMIGYFQSHPKNCQDLFELWVRIRGGWSNEAFCNAEESVKMINNVKWRQP